MLLIGILGLNYYSVCVFDHDVMVGPTGGQTGGRKYGQTALAMTIIDDLWVEIIFDKQGNCRFDRNEKARTYLVGIVISGNKFILSEISLRKKSEVKYFSRINFIALSSRLFCSKPTLTKPKRKKTASALNIPQITYYVNSRITAIFLTFHTMVVFNIKYIWNWYQPIS